MALPFQVHHAIRLRAQALGIACVGPDIAPVAIKVRQAHRHRLGNTAENHVQLLVFAL